MACVGTMLLGVSFKANANKLSIIKSKSITDTITIEDVDWQQTINNMIIVRTNKLDFDILLIKNENKFKALYLECTHYSNSLDVVDDKIICDRHGSEFDFNGNVLKSPAENNLTTFVTTQENNKIIIQMLQNKN